MRIPNNSPDRHPSDDPFGTVKLAQAFRKLAEALAQLNGVEAGVIKADQLNDQEDV